MPGAMRAAVLVATIVLGATDSVEAQSGGSEGLGYIVKTVANGSPAEATGLRGGTSTATIAGEPLVVGGDVILSVQGIDVNHARELARIRDVLNALRSGEPFTVTVLRAGQVHELAGRAP